MGTAARVIVLLLGGILLGLMTAAIIPDELFGAKAVHTSQGTSVTPTDVVLTIHEGLLSLRAQDASINAIFEAVGRQLYIDVEARIPASVGTTRASAEPNPDTSSPHTTHAL